MKQPPTGHVLQPSARPLNVPAFALLLMVGFVLPAHPLSAQDQEDQDVSPEGGTERTEDHTLGFGVYTDERGWLIVGDETGEQRLTNQPVPEWQAQPDYLVYMDNTRELHLWRDGEDNPLGAIGPLDWQALPGQLVYRMPAHYTVFQNGVRTQLVTFRLNPDDLYIGDSLLLFFDRLQRLVLLHRGRTRILENLQTEAHGAGADVVAWQDGQGQLWAYWQGRTGVIDSYAPEKVVLGCNTIAWVDRFQKLQIFDRGKRYEPEYGFNVDSLYVGWNTVAWIDDRGEFFAWSSTGEATRTTKLSPNPPRRLDLVDRSLWYVDANGNFYVYQNGRNTMAESWEPGRVEAWREIVVYEDLDRRLHAFASGESTNLTDNIAQSWMLNGPVLQWMEYGLQAEYLRIEP